MDAIWLYEEVLATVSGLEDFFRQCLPESFKGVSKSAHYRNGQVGDLCGGREFQFSSQASVYRVRFQSDFLSDHSLEDILERLDRWKLIERLQQKGCASFLVAEQGVLHDRE